jgi:hypothetical protein
MTDYEKLQKVIAIIEKYCCNVGSFVFDVDGKPIKVSKINVEKWLADIAEKIKENERDETTC